MGGKRLSAPALVFVLCAAVYTATLGSRAAGTSSDPHFVYLAESLLAGQLSVVGNEPPGKNDWAKYGDRWYVSFPPFPAVVLAPLVAVFGRALWDRLVWAILAGLAPALLYVLLRDLRERGLSQRAPRDDLLLVLLYAFGSVHYYVSVQGTVWFAAHVVCSALLALYLLWSFAARRPWLAGLAFSAAFMTRPSVLPLGGFFVFEALRSARADASAPLSGVGAFLRDVQWRRALSRLAAFATPVLLVGLLAMWMNYARFDDPFEFGHSHLEIKWRRRIDTWGLFNYHYLAKNLSVFLASLPWLSAEPPYIKISRHGLALWLTTPHLLLLLWPLRQTATTLALTVAAAAVALLDLSYQNSGWIQFGYRFSLDYAMALFVLLALGGRRFGKGFVVMLVLAVVVNAFGAFTFDRAARFYDNDPSQRRVFQPD